MNPYDELFEQMDKDKAFMEFYKKLHEFNKEHCVSCERELNCYYENCRDSCELFKKEYYDKR